MKISTISETHSTFKGKNNTLPVVTPKHITIVNSDINKGLIAQLDSLGLINRAMLAKVRKAIAIETEKSTARSLATIDDILKHPRFTIEQRDSGFWFKTEDPHNFREMLDTYASGKTYTTPVFSREREYAAALQNIATNGSEKDCKKAVAIYNRALDSGLFEKHEKMLGAINKETRLQRCIPREGTYGLLQPFDKGTISEFVADSLILPAKRMFEGQITRMLKKLHR